MDSRPGYLASSSSTTLERDQRPQPLDFTGQQSEESLADPYYQAPDSGYRSQYPAANYLSPGLTQLKETNSSVSLVHTDDHTSEHRLNAGNDWNSRAGRSQPRKRSVLSEALFPDSVACRLYLLIVVVETLLDLAIESIILARVNQTINSKSAVSSSDSPTLARSRIPVYLGVFGMAHVFQFLLALDAVYYKNVLQFLFLAIFNALFFVSVALHLSCAASTPNDA